jgi:putative spermidine/putrescine transport system ATP-binding protein
MILEQINIRYNKEDVIRNMNLKIHPGEIFVLLGPSGSGKTTLLKGIAGLVPIISGKFCWQNGKGTVGLVFQEPRLFPHLTVIDNIAFSLRVQGFPKKERREQARQFIKILQLEGLENRYPHELSGGQQQRVSLGRTLIVRPDLLLLDEPFSSLDTPLRMELIEWLSQYQHEMGFSILWVTHFLDEAFSVADRIGILMEGGLQQVGTSSELYQKPSSEKVAAFLALPNRFSRDQWQKWFQLDLTLLDTKKRGWIPANRLQLVDNNLKSDDLSAGLISGVVTRLKAGRDGLTLVVKSGDCLIEVSYTEKSMVPILNENVSVRVPFDEIVWYDE